jgi:hypothetical protein
MTTPQPNREEHPEIIEWMKNYRAAQQAYAGLDLNDSSNFLGDKHKEELVIRLYDDVAHANQELKKWCEHYGLSYGGLNFTT